MSPRRRRNGSGLPDVSPEARKGLLDVARADHERGKAAGESVLDIATRSSTDGARVPKHGPSPHLQKRLALEGVEPGSEKARRSAAASVRTHTGAAFQADVNVTCQAIGKLALGFIQEHAIPFYKSSELGWMPRAGGAPCDFSGHVNAFPISVDTVDGPSEWRLVKTPEAPIGKRVPVVFDAKVAAMAAAEYEHEPKRRHQLLTLREASRSGAAAFLLVYVRRIEAAVVIGPEHFPRLIIGNAVPMLEALRSADSVTGALGTARQAAPIGLRAGERPRLLRPGTVLEALPAGETARPVKLLLPAVPYMPPLGWDFSPALGYAFP